MHEMSLAMAVIGQVEEAAQRAGAVTAVRSVRLQVGELAVSYPMPSPSASNWPAPATVLEGAELVTEAVPDGPAAHPARTNGPSACRPR